MVTMDIFIGLLYLMHGTFSIYIVAMMMVMMEHECRANLVKFSLFNIELITHCGLSMFLVLSLIAFELSYNRQTLITSYGPCGRSKIVVAEYRIKGFASSMMLCHTAHVVS